MPQASGSLCLVSERGLHRSFFGFYIWELAFASYTPRLTRVLLWVSLLGALITIIYMAVACYRGEEVKVWNMLLVLGVFSAECCNELAGVAPCKERIKGWK